MATPQHRPKLNETEKRLLRELIHYGPVNRSSAGRFVSIVCNNFQILGLMRYDAPSDTWETTTAAQMYLAAD